MAVHSNCSVQYQTATFRRRLNFCLKVVGRLRKPFFFSCTHYALDIVRSFLGQQLLQENPFYTMACADCAPSGKKLALNCFK